MPHEDQREFYTCPICGITTGNDIDGNEKHDCPEEEDYIKINLSLLTNKPMKESTVPIDEKWKEELQTILLNLSCDRSSDGITAYYRVGNKSLKNVLASFIENLLEQERQRLGWKTHDCSEMLSTEIENAVEEERKRITDEAERLPAWKLPNGSYLSAVSINKVISIINPSKE